MSRGNVLYVEWQPEEKRKKIFKKSLWGMVCGKYVKMGNPLMAMEYKQYTKGRE